MKNKILKQFLSLSLLTLACAFAFTGCSNKGNGDAQTDASLETTDEEGNATGTADENKDSAAITDENADSATIADGDTNTTKNRADASGNPSAKTSLSGENNASTQEASSAQTLNPYNRGLVVLDGKLCLRDPSSGLQIRDTSGSLLGTTEESGSIFSMTASNGFLFYTKMGTSAETSQPALENKLYRMSADGTGITCLLEGKSFTVHALNNILFVTGSSSDGTAAYEVQDDGSLTPLGVSNSYAQLYQNSDLCDNDPTAFANGTPAPALDCAASAQLYHGLYEVCYKDEAFNELTFTPLFGEARQHIADIYGKQCLFTNNAIVYQSYEATLHLCDLQGNHDRELFTSDKPLSIRLINADENAIYFEQDNALMKLTLSGDAQPEVVTAAGDYDASYECDIYNGILYTVDKNSKEICPLPLK